MWSLHSFYYKTRHQVYTSRRHLFEAFGYDRFSRAGLDGLDARLQSYVDFENGFFIEAGANDGFTQSNTYWLERFRGWHGILIEPLPALFERCKQERPGSLVVHCALVSTSWRETHVTMRSAGLMSFVEGVFHQPDAQPAHERSATRLHLFSKDEPPLKVPARTLNAVLREYPDLPPIDLLSLDVEGGERQVLEGLDFNRHQPGWILIETDNLEAVRPLLSSHYDLVSQLSYHDYLIQYKSDDRNGKQKPEARPCQF